MSMETRALGDAIRAARMKKGLTQDALSELLDITPTHLKNIEGSRRKPSVPLLFQMMELLDLSVDALVFQSREESQVPADGRPFGAGGGGAGASGGRHAGKIEHRLGRGPEPVLLFWKVFRGGAR